MMDVRQGPLKSRAVTYDEFVERLSLLFSSEEEAYRTFQPRPTDVIISPFAKCGTTWLQQIVHSLRTGGDMDFDDIYEVVPFIDVAIDLGIDLDADQRAEPRAFKSHGTWDEVPKGCRYIVSFRDPKDAVVSLYRFMEGWIVEPGSIPLDEFVERRSFDRENGPDYWRHLASWLAQRDNPDVLLLTFEEMKQALRAVVERIAVFIGVDVDDALVDLATQKSSFEFMSAHKGPFSESLVRAHSEIVAGIPPNSDTAKVREGRVGDHSHELSPQAMARFDQIWTDTIGIEFGYPTYQHLVADLRGGKHHNPNR